MKTLISIITTIASTLLLSCCNNQVSEIKVSQLKVLDTIVKTDNLLKSTDSVLLLLFNKLSKRPINLNEFAKRENVLLNFVMSPKNIDTNLYVPAGFQTAVYPLTYISIKPESFKKSILLAKLFVARPFSKSDWLRSDTNEIVLAFEISHRDVKLLNQFAIGDYKSNITDLIGFPNIKKQDTLCYSLSEQQHTTYLEFVCKADTVNKILFKRTKK
jgi:hypothetical protein